MICEANWWRLISPQTKTETARVPLQGQVLSFTSGALRYEAQLTGNKGWKTLCKAQKMDIMTLYGENSVYKYPSPAANGSGDRK